ncbi:5-deoxy-glucuronate isomerase, partial [Faecalibaculum rodentium]
MSNTNTDTKTRLESWKVQSSEEPGFHKVITPDTAECQEAQIFRLNLPTGQSYTLESGDLELHPVLIAGKAKLSDHDRLDQEMERFDSFYIPGQDKVTITALEDSIFYIAGAKYEGIGHPMFRKFDATLPVGDIHQIHGSGSGQREVMMTLAPGDEASR